MGRKLRQKEETNKIIANKQKAPKELNRNSYETHSLSKQENASERVTQNGQKTAHSTCRKLSITNWTAACIQQ